MTLGDIPRDLHDLYEIHEWRHASAILMRDFVDEWDDIVAVLRAFRLQKSRIVLPGGSKSLIAAAIDRPLVRAGWREKMFSTAIRVDDVTMDSPTHKVDCFKNKVGVEIEWNNKDPFFDRDLNNFRLLFDLRALSVGIIVTRCDELQDIFNDLGRGKSYGNSTTHMGKLLPRLNGGGGGGCPVLVFGIRRSLYVEDVQDLEVEELQAEFKAARKSKWRSIGPLLSKYVSPDELSRENPEEDEA